MTEQLHRCLKADCRRNVLILSITESHVQGDDIAEEMREAMLQAIGTTGCRHAVIDFENVQYISSVAFRPLLALRRELVQRGGRVVVCGLNTVVGDIFHTTSMIDREGNMSPMFEMQPTVAEAEAFLERIDLETRDQP
jgi:anti-anti-sigma factor